MIPNASLLGKKKGYWIDQCSENSNQVMSEFLILRAFDIKELLVIPHSSLLGKKKRIELTSALKILTKVMSEFLILTKNLQLLKIGWLSFTTLGGYTQNLKGFTLQWCITCTKDLYVICLCLCGLYCSKNSFLISVFSIICIGSMVIIF